MEKEKKYLLNLLEEHDKCILALSGGPDSMYLFHLLLEIKQEKNIDLVCVHINHNTRKACEKEKEFIEKYMSRYHIPLVYYKIDNYEKNRFTEEEARTKRYSFFKKVCVEEKAKYLFTAHHGDDLVETILMRLLRGSSLEGYAGIKQESEWDNIKIIRPLLSLTKKDILKKLKKEHIPYCTDSSNTSDKYQRNRLRKKVLPILEKESKEYHLKIQKYSNTLLEANRFIQNILEDLEKIVEENNKIKLIEFQRYSEEIQKFYLRYYLKKIYKNDLGKITEKHINNSWEIIYNNKNECSIDIPNKKKFVKEHDYVYIADEIEILKYELICEDKMELPTGYLEKISEYTSKSNYEIHLNSKDIKLPLSITTRKNGMRMEVKNLNGSKSISDIFTDSKMKKSERDSTPILMDANGTVLWILGVKKSKYDLEKDQNYDIIYKYVKRKEE